MTSWNRVTLLIPEGIFSRFPVGETQLPGPEERTPSRRNERRPTPSHRSRKGSPSRGPRATDLVIRPLVFVILKHFLSCEGIWLCYPLQQKQDIINYQIRQAIFIWWNWRTFWYNSLSIPDPLLDSMGYVFVGGSKATDDEVLLGVSIICLGSK